jgi:hypothetical protein
MSEETQIKGTEKWFLEQAKAFLRNEVHSLPSPADLRSEKADGFCRDLGVFCHFFSELFEGKRFK